MSGTLLGVCALSDHLKCLIFFFLLLFLKFIKDKIVLTQPCPFTKTQFHFLTGGSSCLNGTPRGTCIAVFNPLYALSTSQPSLTWWVLGAKNTEGKISLIGTLLTLNEGPRWQLSKNYRLSRSVSLASTQVLTQFLADKYRTREFTFL